MHESSFGHQRMIGIAATLYDGENDADHSYDQPLPPPAVGSVAVPEDWACQPTPCIEASKVQRWTGRGWSGVWRRGWSPTASSALTLARSEYSKSASQAWIVASPGDRAGLLVPRFARWQFWAH